MEKYTNHILIGIALVIVAILGYRWYNSKAPVSVPPVITGSGNTGVADSASSNAVNTAIAQSPSLSARIPLPATRWGSSY